MTWLLRALLVCLPVAAWAEGTRVDQGAALGGIQLDVTLTPGLGLYRPDATVDFRNFSKERPARRSQEEEIPLILTRSQADGSRITYRFIVRDAESQSRAMDFWDRHGQVPSFVPRLPLCRNAGTGGQERISYRLYRPGFGSTATQEMGPEKLRTILPDLRPCPAS
ncbi:hypothetical protein [Falsirhodobacter sp. 20TX0035]|uniref:hypothetical protein n=1 Tax=Falsirhodobacter sp. 20TX0035 TaxID=3022019 RepID=UPI0023304B22|nr:hypothetical protein [Falsirhodobacter sp. 20TX0035]MDB6453989.1 hypothetical protein [Falsirhodobacter sp. 20TX0035]